ncbi:hypothetical protein A2313_01520 [Candidatus Roizmanbacteria bacterium RIFOXYB2_FULL_41_10]|uniref:DNA binding HTH domain-containing protein n=1 Tax=Candidatus Roizmanbacteria bacterium RIFOXYA1_FULL_41_12 TaxID=1802082 RepID=A0A1F7KGJ3_9BACT|nr:MAG: hypothetical protein A2262_02590 [Candidatus Roizmanbacteria bacterium RIFOXYA2_FULL_41_8]OGK66991.1 MAG: hypothetical protein A2209_02955 [Candidatus Roizmanbacteria bacterium RIFOXYA1_FULL_41_12]OGK71048.1 MAG: hypothetical protein A2313_01520 [Candidatus Roizmanbacteria bacterium RIFOXYB2_FULL_41_10]OGK71716.1 MAG: hypothetical protein A2403_04635 [Candidatus Roizmanbacteria bacterium RIFOXYC1_FULL_41_16]OGK72935.1 MAG: hypothetical protein A2459_00240 [Candidatus Roizmanbacteria bac
MSVELSSINSFFSHLARDASANNQRMGPELPFSDKEHVNAYMQYATDNGIYDDLLKYVIAVYSRLDFSTADDLVLQSLWRSYYFYPHKNKQFEISSIRALAHVSLKLLVRIILQHNDLGGRNAGHCDHNIKSIALRPVEQHVINREELTELGKELEINPEVIAMLLMGYSLKEISQKLNTPYGTLKKRISELRNWYKAKRTSDTFKLSKKIVSKRQEQALNIFQYVREIEPRNKSEERILIALKQSGGKITEAARSLGVSVNTVTNTLISWGFYRK